MTLELGGLVPLLLRRALSAGGGGRADVRPGGAAAAGATAEALLALLAPELLPLDPGPDPGEAGPPLPAPQLAPAAADPAAWLARAYEAALAGGPASGPAAGPAGNAAPGPDAGRARRRRTGAFFTPGYLADRLAGMALDPALAAAADLAAVRVVDPAMGAGGLLLAALRRMAAAGRPARAVATAQLFGVERDPAAAAAARLAVWLAAAPGELPAAAEAAALRLHLVAGQALLGPGQVPGGLDWAQAFPAIFPPGGPAGFDVLLANPPWGAATTAAERAALRRSCPYPLRGEVNTYALFLAATARWVRPGGWAAWIVPEGWLVNRNDEPLRRHLLATAAVAELAVLRKGVFPAAPDAVPVLVLLRPGLPQDRARVRLFGFTRPVADLPALRWAAERDHEPARWAQLPLAIFPVARSARLEPVFRQVESLGRPLVREAGGEPAGAAVRLADGVYKTRLMPLLTPPGPAGPPPAQGPLFLPDGAHPALVSAAELARYRVSWRGWTAGPAGWAALPAPEQARAARPKLIFHALKKPGAPHRVSCCLDPGEGRAVPGVGIGGGLLASNNFVTLLPGPEAPDLRYLMALYNSRLLGRWYAEHFIQVNIEAFTLGAVPIRPVAAAPAGEAGARRTAAWRRAVRAGTGGAIPPPVLAGVEAELAAAGDGPVPWPVYRLVAELAGLMQARPDPDLDRMLGLLVCRLYGLTPEQVALLEVPE